MKRILLQKIIQHDTVCYIGRTDPRSLCKIATEIEMSATQEAQRPLSEKRVRDIASYVESPKGILPNTLTLATKDNRFKVLKSTEINDLYYIDFPNTEAEFEQYKNSLDVMDGQHRLYSFSDAIRTISDTVPYEIGFTLYITPTLQERRKIFVSCNEKQEKVNGNLLMWFRSQLDMLTSNEKNFFNLVTKLNTVYPLKNKIIMSAEKISRGFKAKEVMEALKNAHIQDLCISDMPLDEEQKVKVISTYLTAWENVVGFNFTESTAKTAGAAIKMAGLRFMLLLLQPMWDRAMNMRRKFNLEFIEDTIRNLISAYSVPYEQFFTNENHKMWFRDRTAITEAANAAVNRLKALGVGTFNPLGD